MESIFKLIVSEHKKIQVSYKTITRIFLSTSGKNSKSEELPPG